MYLIDTSVWIDSLRQVDNAPTRFFKSLITDRTPYGITGIIYQEVLQGARELEDYEQLRSHLGSLTFWHPVDPVETRDLCGGGESVSPVPGERHHRAFHGRLSDRSPRHRAWADAGA